ncbi:MAG: hypothetical protein Q8K63_01575, partial [Acidimicrobiales bacterium]|nr:hypothetical protein [Acidimicrobiales bacterium]
MMSAPAHFAEHGWWLADTLDAEQTVTLQSWVDEVSEWPDGSGDWLHYREQTDEGPKLCRSENFVPFHEGLRVLLTETLAKEAALLLGEPAVLYKEKINYKLPGGAGYSP